MQQQFQVYYVDKTNRIQAMMLCSFTDRINWVQKGLGIASWNYKMNKNLTANSLSQVYNICKTITVDKKKKKQKFERAISVGDVICVGSQAWFVTLRGFQKIPSLLWKMVNKS